MRPAPAPPPPLPPPNAQVDQVKKVRHTVEEALAKFGITKMKAGMGALCDGAILGGSWVAISTRRVMSTLSGVRRINSHAYKPYLQLPINPTYNHP